MRAEKMLAAISNAATKYPTSFGIWASLLMRQATGTNEIAVTGSQSYAVAALVLSQEYLPNKILLASDKENDLFPMLQGKQLTGPPLIYLCKKYVCKAPFKNAEDFFKAVKTGKI